MSIRELIIAALATRLEIMTVINGYSYGYSIHRAQNTFDENDLPACSIWAGSEDSERFSSATKQTMTVDLDLHANYGKDTVDFTANKLLADIRKAMETHDPALYALADGVFYSGSEATYPDDGVASVSVRASYLITYFTVRGDPASKP